MRWMISPLADTGTSPKAQEEHNWMWNISEIVEKRR